MRFEIKDMMCNIQIDVPVSSTTVQSLILGTSGSMEHGWEVGWSLASSTDGQTQVNSSELGQTYEWKEFPFLEINENKVPRL